jgi:hypothetical protein
VRGFRVSLDVCVCWRSCYSRIEILSCVASFAVLFCSRLVIALLMATDVATVAEEVHSASIFEFSLSVASASLFLSRLSFHSVIVVALKISLKAFRVSIMIIRLFTDTFSRNLRYIECSRFLLKESPLFFVMILEMQSKISVCGSSK